jgi:hypothetical protein
MRKAFYGLSVTGALGFLLSLGAPWWIVTLDTGSVITITGLDASPSASSLAAAAGAAFGVGLVLRGLWRRAVHFLQAGLALGAGVVWWQIGDLPRAVALSDITLLTGLSGQSAFDAVSTTDTTGFLALGIGSALIAVMSGFLGAAMPDSRRRASRYERHGGEDAGDDPVVAWDRLSDGEDPTTR